MIVSRAIRTDSNKDVMSDAAFLSLLSIYIAESTFNYLLSYKRELCKTKC